MAMTGSDAWLPPGSSSGQAETKDQVAAEKPENVQKAQQRPMDSLFFLLTPDGASQVRLADPSGLEGAGVYWNGATPIDGTSSPKIMTEKKKPVPECAVKLLANTAVSGTQIDGNFNPKLVSLSSVGGASEPSGMSTDGFESGGEEDLDNTPQRKTTRTRSWPCESAPCCLDKEEQRKERNRKAQRKFRERQRHRISDLEAQATIMKEKIRELEISNCELARENEVMRSYMGLFGGAASRTGGNKAA